jgi:hypothetical protein
LANARIGYQNTGQVEILFIIFVKHCCGDVWDAAASIVLAGYVNLEVLNTEELFPVLEEINKVLRYLLL